MEKAIEADNTAPRIRLALLPVIAISLYWAGDLIGKSLVGPEFPAGPRIYTSMRALLGYAVPTAFMTVGIICLAARYLNWNWRGDFGFESSDIGKQALVGLALGLISFIVVTVGSSVLIQFLPKENPSPFMPLLTDRKNLVSWLFLGIFCGGFVEELERVFVLRSFENAWGRRGIVAGLLLSSIVFGVGHFNQGMSGAISTAVFAMIYGYVFIRRRKIIEIIVAHGIHDATGVIAAYFVFRQSA